MEGKLRIYNTYSRKPEVFVPHHQPHVGLYVCGPTVYGEAHLGHARPAITFDVIFRYLQHLGYKVRYVRNITDVGHLEHDADSGEDKIGKKARLEQLEPMEVVQRYILSYHRNIEQLNCLPPSIEPRASGHIIEQINMISDIIDAGYAYEVNGSVYFDIEKYHKKYHYGGLSGRVLENLIDNTRKLEGQVEKRNAADFALWKKAMPEHIMRWPSPWSDGFPGWHLECSVMSAKYLGMPFDIHGGGMDLLFPHHECEIAQTKAAYGKAPCKYWIHNNLITIKGQKMGKSLGNFITLDELFTGQNDVLDDAYDPMTIRFFILQAHYRSTLDFSNDAIKSAGKGLRRLMAAWKHMNKCTAADKSTFDVAAIIDQCSAAMNDDFNTPVLIAHLFDACKQINQMATGSASLTEQDMQQIKDAFHLYVFDIMGLKDAETSNESDRLDRVLEQLIQWRLDARNNKDYQLSDKIRETLSESGIRIKDGPDGTTWEMAD